MKLRRWAVVDVRSGKVESRHWTLGGATAQALIEDQIENVSATGGGPNLTPRHRKAERR